MTREAERKREIEVKEEDEDEGKGVQQERIKQQRSLNCPSAGPAAFGPHAASAPAGMVSQRQRPT